MADEIELIHDGQGFAVVGRPTAIQRFLDSLGTLALSQELPLDRIVSALDAGAKVTGLAADLYENSGRYVKLTKESAERVREFGLMPTKSKGISHAMLGERGSISKWIQVEDGPASLATNPAVLSGIGGLMTQIAKQAEANELKALLAKIDEKLDDVRRAQRDSVLAKMDRATLAIAEAQTIREHEGNRETAWRKIEAESGTIAEVQGSALRALDALADKVEGKTKVGELARLTHEVERDLSVWLAVLARCCQLQDEFAVLEIEHVMEKAPQDLDGHRMGLHAAQRERHLMIVEKTQILVRRLDDAGAIANSNVLLHVQAARSVIESVNSAAVNLGGFHAPLGMESRSGLMEPIRWRDALRDRRQLKNAGREAGQKALTALLVAGGTAAAAAASAAVAKTVKGDD